MNPLILEATNDLHVRDPTQKEDLKWPTVSCSDSDKNKISALLVDMSRYYDILLPISILGP